ncbi:arginine--tRNA ligase [Acidilobus sp.]|uniref:arginine--tRNA ligase n=1 Tax=Acidilobus sp. TaxID=1872109 RepID=UPI003CFFF846
MLDPVTRAIVSSSEILSDILGVDQLVAFRDLMEPIKEEYGDSSFPSIRYSKDPDEVAKILASRLASDYNIYYVDAKNLKGFTNLTFRCGDLVKAVVEWAKNSGELEVPKISRPLKIVVEHTSANPIHPLHIGHARNACIGDSLARLLRSRGHSVVTRFYIDDVGRQVSIAALGVKLLGIDVLKESQRLSIKPDSLVGWIYAVTSTTIDLLNAKKAGNSEEAEKLASTLARLKSQDPGNFFDKLYNALSSLENPEAAVADLNNRYEKGLEPEKTLIRSMVQAVLEGFKQSLDTLGVSFDLWDWESDLVWSGLVSKLIEEAKGSRYFIKYKDADAIDIPQIISEEVQYDKEALSSIKLPKGFSLPPLILLRSDGTTLYTTRDLAYSVLKFSQTNADKVINVIGADQRLPQLQLRVALYGLGHRREALNLIHYDYEIVRLTTGSMHGRRGEYVTLDSLLTELSARALKEVIERNPSMSKEEAMTIARSIGVGAIRYFMVHMSASKPLTFSVDRAMNLRESSGPYLQYTYVRAVNILEKHGKVDLNSVDPDKCTEPRRRLLVKALKTPLVIAKAADDLAPEDLVSHLADLADNFNAWYEQDSVIREPDVGARELKALIVDIVRQSLGIGMSVLGIPTLRRM